LVSSQFDLVLLRSRLVRVTYVPNLSWTRLMFCQCLVSISPRNRLGFTFISPRSCLSLTLSHLSSISITFVSRPVFCMVHLCLVLLLFLVLFRHNSVIFWSSSVSDSVLSRLVSCMVCLSSKTSSIYEVRLG